MGRSKAAARHALWIGSDKANSRPGGTWRWASRSSARRTTVEGVRVVGRASEDHPPADALEVGQPPVGLAALLAHDHQDEPLVLSARNFPRPATGLALKQSCPGAKTGVAHVQVAAVRF